MSGVTHTARRVLRFMRAHWLALVALTMGCFVIASTIVFFWPRTLQFSYNKPTCYFNPVFLPGLVKVQPSASFTADIHRDVAIGGFTLFSATTCIQLIHPPKPGTSETLTVAPFGNTVLRDRVTVNAGGFPTIAALTKLDAPVSVKKALLFSLSQTDQTFTYQLAANNAIVPCAKSGQEVACDASKLNLAQSTTYTIELRRMLGTVNAGTAISQKITTINAVEVATTSITNNIKIYSVPTNILFTLNKPVQTPGVVHVQLVKADGSKQDIAASLSFDGTKLAANFPQPLPRSAQFVLTLEGTIATDGAYLPAPYTLAFSTSGGPAVAGISIGSYNVPSGSSFNVAFDSNLLATQPLQKFITMQTPAGPVAIAIKASGNRATVTPPALPPCTTFTIKVLDGLQNEFGVSGGSAWQYTSRTTCRVAFSIGSSVRGRSIVAYKFGGGPSVIVFTGTMHGNEHSGSYTLTSFLDYLEANAGGIPANRTVVVIPTVNPDGSAANSRLNANGVDLNRNFPANNWKAGVTEPNGAFLPTGGGVSPLDQPESAALASYVTAVHPRLVLDYHANSALVAANESGDSQTIANNYARQVGLPSYGNNAPFGYDTTGAFEDWLHDKHGIPAILIELTANTSNEFSRHRAAMWALVQLP